MTGLDQLPGISGKPTGAMGQNIAGRGEKGGNSRSVSKPDLLPNIYLKQKQGKKYEAHI